MFDRHCAEITVMQFTVHSLPVHQFVAVAWDFNPVPYCQPSSPTPMEYALPLSLEWYVWRGRGSIYNNKLATEVKGNPKAPFSIAIEPRCMEGRYSFPWIAPVYP